MNTIMEKATKNHNNEDNPVVKMIIINGINSSSLLG